MSITTETIRAASKIKKGEFVRRSATAKKTYVHAGYCRINKAYQLDDFNDISRCIYVKGATALFVGFDF